MLICRLLVQVAVLPPLPPPVEVLRQQVIRLMASGFLGRRFVGERLSAAPELPALVFLGRVDFLIQWVRFCLRNSVFVEFETVVCFRLLVLFPKQQKLIQAAAFSRGFLQHAGRRLLPLLRLLRHRPSLPLVCYLQRLGAMIAVSSGRQPVPLGVEMALILLVCLSLSLRMFPHLFDLPFEPADRLRVLLRLRHPLSLVLLLFLVGCFGSS